MLYNDQLYSYGTVIIIVQLLLFSTVYPCKRTLFLTLLFIVYSIKTNKQEQNKNKQTKDREAEEICLLGFLCVTQMELGSFQQDVTDN